MLLELDKIDNDRWTFINGIHYPDLQPRWVKAFAEFGIAPNKIGSASRSKDQRLPDPREVAYLSELWFVENQRIHC